MTDALTDILDSVHMSGSVFSRAALSAPWGVESGTLDTGIFHAVVRGRAWIRLAAGADDTALERGDVVFLPYGDNHIITHAEGAPAKPIGLLTSVDERGMGHLIVDGGGAPTSLLCGSVTYDQGDAHPVFAMLPPLIHVRDLDGRLGGTIETLVGLIAAEVDEPVAGSETVIARLTDVLVVTILRTYIAGLGEGEGGWLGGLRDDRIREALGHIHRTPELPWTAQELARIAGMSRSAFFARFRETVGESPAQYLTRWRIQLATGLLREDRLSVAAVARQVGYETEAAFSNAFLRTMGVRPGAYKRAA